MTADWTSELLEDSSVKDALSLLDPNLALRAKREMDDLAHASFDGPKSALTDRMTPYVTVVGTGVKREGEIIDGGEIIAEGNPLIVTQHDIEEAAGRAMSSWLDGAKKYRKSVCEKAGTGAQIEIVWRLHPQFIMWTDWGNKVRIAMRGRLAFETIEDAVRPGCASSDHNAMSNERQPCCPAQSVDFLALNKAFSQ